MPRRRNRALELQAALQRENPRNAAYQQERARTYYNRGILRAARGAGAADDYKAAIAWLEPLAEVDPPGARQELARALNNYGSSSDRSHACRKRSSSSSAPRGFTTRSLARDPQNREYRFEMAKFCSNLANLLLAQDKLDLAEQRTDEALGLLVVSSRARFLR